MEDKIPDTQESRDQFSRNVLGQGKGKAGTTRGTGDKYHKRITGLDYQATVVDVYAVLAAFGVTCPARQHAIKKLLMAGNRSKGSQLQDLKEAVCAVERAVQLQEVVEHGPNLRPEVEVCGR